MTSGAPSPLLLGEFLQALRQAGHAVGVREHQAVLRLLEGYDGASLDELGELLTALLGGDAEGARRVRRVYAAQRQRWLHPSLVEIERVHDQLMRASGAAADGAGSGGRAASREGAASGVGVESRVGAESEVGAGSGVGAASGVGVAAGDGATSREDAESRDGVKSRGGAVDDSSVVEPGAALGGAALGGAALGGWLWRGLLGVVLVALLVIAGILFTQQDPAPSLLDAGVAADSSPGPVDGAAYKPPPPALDGGSEIACPPPEPSQELQLGRGLGAGLAVSLLLLGLQYLPHRKRRQRDARRERSRQALARSQGPHEFTLKLPGQRKSLLGALREAVDDLALTLARVADGVGRELDERRVLDELARAGFVTRVPLLAQRSSGALVLLLDQGGETLHYHQRVDGLRAELRGRGLRFLEVTLHPRSDGVMVSRGLAAGLHEPVALPLLGEALEHGTVVLVSAGGSHLREGGRPALWLQTLAAARRRCWLHPGGDPRQFNLPPGLPLRAWPLSAAGMREAQVELRGGAPQRDPQALIPERRVRARDIETLLRLLAVDPQADAERLTWLRERHAASVSDDAQVELWRRRDAAPRGHLWLPVVELQGLLQRQRAEEAQGVARFQEQAVRRDLLQAYARSEPPLAVEGESESVAHLRWRLAVALQRLHLHGELGDEALVADALRTLDELARSKVWRDVVDALGVQPKEEQIAPVLVLPPSQLSAEDRKRFKKLLRQIERDELPLPGEELVDDALRRMGSGLGMADVVDHWLPALLVACLLAAIADLGLWLTGPAFVWWQERAPVEGAYELAGLVDPMVALRGRELVDARARMVQAERAGVELAEGGLIMRRLKREAPVLATLWHCTRVDGSLVQGPTMSLSSQNFEVPSRAHEATVYQLRAKAGRLWYVSNSVLVPGKAMPRLPETLPPPVPPDMTADQADPSPQTRAMMVWLDAAPGQVVPAGARFRWSDTRGKSGIAQAGRPFVVALGRVVLSGSVPGFVSFTHTQTLESGVGPVGWRVRLTPAQPPEPLQLADMGRATLPIMHREDPSSLTTLGVTPERRPSLVLKALDPDYHYGLARKLSPMVTIPGGSFVRGDKEWADTKPQEVKVNNFSLGITEVTVVAYRACHLAQQRGDIRASGCTAPSTGEYCNWEKEGKDNYPINCVNAAQAESFCRFLALRLPTETEWEYAARGGKELRRYPWGEGDPEPSGDPRLCWNRYFSGMPKGTCPVQGPDQRKRNAFGLADMAGNVYEWTSSNYCEDYVSSCWDSRRAVRGGSWGSSTAAAVRVACRDANSPDDHYDSLGFRCAGPPR